MSGTVTEFACQVAHPQHGEAVKCERKRWHAGDHRGTVDEQPDGQRLVSWADWGVPGPLQPLPVDAYPPGARELDVSISDGADIPEDWTAELQAADPWHEPGSDALRRLAALVLLMVLLAMPAVLVILYREAL